MNMIERGMPIKYKYHSSTIPFKWALMFVGAYTLFFVVAILAVIHHG